MLVHVASHFPWTYPQGKRFHMCVMELDHADNVGEFKKRYEAETGFPANLATLCYNGKPRPDDGPIWHEPLEPTMYVGDETPSMAAHGRSPSLAPGACFCRHGG